MGRFGWLGRHGGRMRLRDRVALAFALTALLLSVVLAGAAWLLASSYVNHQNEMSAVAQTVDSALLLRERIRGGDEPSTAMVNDLRYPPGAAALLVYGGHSYPSASAVDIELPPDVSAQATHGAEKYSRIEIGGQPYLVVGVPLSRHGDGFFELYSLADLHSTFRMLWLLVLLGAAGTAMLGLALGRLASHRLLQPIEEVTRAAGEIAAGDLSARLSTDTEPDLAALAKSFNRTAAALERRVRADARFAGDVSHELRTPLTTMLNSIALLQHRRSELPPDVVEPLDLLSEDLQRFRRLVVDLLDISRADGGYGKDLEPVLIADLVRRAADGALGRSVTLVAPGAEETVVHADKRRLERVFTNLVENAEVHGRGCTAVRVGLCREGVRIVVDDRGDGVPAERRERIFERFARDGSSATPGVGLGLAIVSRHVRWHGGRVFVENRVNGGARFVVELPLGKRASRQDGNGGVQAPARVQAPAGAEAPAVSADAVPGAARAAEQPAASQTPELPGRPAHT